MNDSTRSCFHHRWSFHRQRGTTRWQVFLGFQIQLWRWFLGLYEVSYISPEHSSLEIYLVGTRCYLFDNRSLSPQLFFSLMAAVLCPLCLRVEAQEALLFLCCKTVLVSSFFLSLSLSSVPSMIFGCNKVPAVGNSVFVRCPNNLCTGDDPTLGEGVLCQSKMAKYGSCPLAFALVSNFLAVLQHFQSCHLIVDSVVRTFGGQNARRMQIL